MAKEKKYKVSFYCKLRKGDVGKITIHQVENDSRNEEIVASMHDLLTACDRFSTIYCTNKLSQQITLNLLATLQIARAIGKVMKRSLECCLLRNRLNGAMPICNYMSVTQC